MKMFEPVVIACDQTSLDLALPIRAALELFRLRAYLHFCVQKRNVLDFFAGRIPESKYVVFCGHGQISFHVVDEVDGRWKEVELRVVPENVPELVRLPGRRIVSTGCGNGTESLAKAFLKTGCEAFIAPTRPIEMDSTALFVITFFYHLLASERPLGRTCTDREAVERAATIDSETASYRYYGR